MNEKQKQRWDRVRAKGRVRYLISNVVAAALSVAVAYALWWLSVYVWLGGSAPRPAREPWVVIAIAAGSAVAGYFQASRQWRRNEREYSASAEVRAERRDYLDGRNLTTACTRPATRTCHLSPRGRRAGDAGR